MFKKFLILIAIFLPLVALAQSGTSVKGANVFIEGDKDVTICTNTGDVKISTDCDSVSMTSWKFNKTTGLLEGPLAPTSLTLPATVATTSNSVTLSGSLAITDTDKGLLLGASSIDSDITDSTGVAPRLFQLNSASGQDHMAFVANGANANGNVLTFLKTRSTAGDANTIVSSGDSILDINARIADGAAYVNAARIRMKNSGTPGTNDSPGAIEFATSADGSTTLVTALTIESDQDLVMTGDLVLADGQNLALTGASSANQACDTTCTGGCVAGWDTGTSVFVSCAAATADTCLCTK